MSEELLGGAVTLHHGDSRDVLKLLPDNSVDSVVTDPPYALVSIVKRFGADGAAPATGNEAYARASAGFMGRTWDTGETAFAVEFWAEVMRVLKPGGHVIAFSGTRTYHRLAAAIEDAGFEIRDMISWLYGSGFPKSHDVSKGIDKRGGANITWFGPWLREERERRGITQKSLAVHFPSKTGNLTGCVANWELGLNIPTPDQFNTLCRVLDLPFGEIAGAEREVVGAKAGNLLAVAPGQDNDRSATTLDITAPATPEAQQWQGWGTALKPACEPIVLARKPLTGTVAANVLAHGTGALNVDACRVGTERPPTTAKDFASWRAKEGREDSQEAKPDTRTDVGRWPANVVHDGSEEVVEGFPNSKSGEPREPTGSRQRQSGFAMTDGSGGFGDDGSAARFFYSAKADAMDRIGSKHPTVKPVDLMQWLCRLITPPGGVILDPFAGSGTTGEAAFLEGFKCILVEREADYCVDIRARMELASAGEKSKRRAIAKRKGGDEPVGGLFG